MWSWMFNGLFYDLNISDNESIEKIRWSMEEIEYKKVCGFRVLK